MSQPRQHICTSPLSRSKQWHERTAYAAATTEKQKATSNIHTDIYLRSFTLILRLNYMF